MQRTTKISRRFNDTPRDKPRADRVEHANLDRPGAQAHPKAATMAGVWRHSLAWTAR